MFSIRQESKRTKIGLTAILVVFMAVGIFSVLHYGNSLLLGSLDTFNNDDVKYIRSAWTLLDTGVLTYQSGSPTVFIMPGLPYVLAFFMFIFGKFSGIVAFRLFQVALQAFSLYLLFLLGRKVFNSKIALIACALSLFYLPEFYAPNLVLTETIFKTLILLLVYISLWALEQKSLSLYLWGGLVWILAIYFRPTAGIFPLVILIMWIKAQYTWKEMVRFALPVLLIFLALMSPWWIRNYATFDRFIPLTLSSGNPFLQGTFVHYIQSPEEWVSYEITGDEIVDDAHEKQAGWERLKLYATKEPLKYLYWYTLGKTLFFWATPFYWQEMLGAPFVPVYLYHLGIMGFAVYGMVKSRKNRGADPRWRTFLLLTILCFTLVYLPYYAFSRYAYPIMPLVIAFAAHGLWVRYQSRAAMPLK